MMKCIIGFAHYINYRRVQYYIKFASF